MSAPTRLLVTLGLLLVSSAPTQARTIRVPSEQPTIQAGIDAAVPGDTVLVAPGAYSGAGNRDIEIIEKDLVVRAEGGPQATIIDCQGRAGDPHRGFLVRSNEPNHTTLEGFWIRNGYVDHTVPVNAGGAIFCTGSRPPRITNCVFAGNAAEIGGAVAVAFGEGTLVADHCTFVGNAAAFGGAGVAAGIASVNLAQCIIAFSSGSAVECAAGGSATLRCCDLYGNAGGDWTGCVAGQGGVHGNIAADPLFCDAPHGDLTLDARSPCAPPQSGDCGLIGALPIGCGPTTAVPDAQPSTWGAIKASYR